MVRWLRTRPVEWYLPTEQLDVWSFRQAERLKVHEARTDADLHSCVVRGSVRVADPPWWTRRVA